MSRVVVSLSMKRVLLLTSTVLGSFACGAAPADHAPYMQDLVVLPDAGPAVDGTVDPGTDADPCATHATGCPCDVEQQTVECGIIRQQFGDYVRCSTAYRTCVNGAWSPCTGDRIVGSP